MKKILIFLILGLGLSLNASCVLKRNSSTQEFQYITTCLQKEANKLSELKIKEIKEQNKILKEILKEIKKGK